MIRSGEAILPKWIHYLILSDEFNPISEFDVAGQQRLVKDYAQNRLIPFPPLETQQRIVAAIEREQALVNTNQELISLFEQKIKDRIAAVWGTKPDDAETAKQAIPYVSADKQLAMVAEDQPSQLSLPI